MNQRFSMNTSSNPSSNKQTNKHTSTGCLPCCQRHTYSTIDRSSWWWFFSRRSKTNNVRAAPSWCAAVNKRTKGWVHLILRSQCGAPKKAADKKWCLASLCVPHEDRSTELKDNQVLAAESSVRGSWMSCVIRISNCNQYRLKPVLGINTFWFRWIQLNVHL